FKKKTSGVRLLWCDLPSGRVTQEWVLPNKYCAPFDLHADGRQIIVRRLGIQHVENEALELWTIAPDGQLHLRTWMPHWSQTPKPDPRSYYTKAVVRWAGFVGRDHIVSVCEDGELHIWERQSLRRVGSFMGVLGLPAVTPDGTLLAFVTGEDIALLDPAAGKIIGARRL